LPSLGERTNSYLTTVIGQSGLFGVGELQRDDGLRGALAIDPVLGDEPGTSGQGHDLLNRAHVGLHRALEKWSLPVIRSFLRLK